MAQLRKGTTYTATGDSSFVTHTNLNAHVDNAKLIGGAIGEQVPNSVSTDGDELLLKKGDDLFKQTKAEFTNHINSNTINVGTITATSVISNSVVPIGSIIMWSGSPTDFLLLPPNWKLCDGSNGTPDLRNRFIVAAGGEHAIGDTGGDDGVELTAANMPEHDHQIRIRQQEQVEIWGSSVITIWDLAPNAGDTSYTQTRTTLKSGSVNPEPFIPIPPFYALAYIMRIA
jgi:hypothetical protein